MMKHGFIQQFKENYLSIFSLFIAIAALFHNTRLYEKAESNRNIRMASFEVLMKLGQLQQVVNKIHYIQKDDQDLLLEGWGYIALIADLSRLIPQPVPNVTDHLIKVWKADVDHLKNDQEVDAISQEIDETRKAILEVIQNLD